MSDFEYRELQPSFVYSSALTPKRWSVHHEGQIIGYVEYSGRSNRYKFQQRPTTKLDAMQLAEIASYCARETEKYWKTVP